jgi:hypothetical protein
MDVRDAGLFQTVGSTNRLDEVGSREQSPPRVKATELQCGCQTPQVTHGTGRQCDSVFFNEGKRTAAEDIPRGAQFFGLGRGQRASPASWSADRNCLNVPSQLAQLPYFAQKIGVLQRRVLTQEIGQFHRRNSWRGGMRMLRIKPQCIDMASATATRNRTDKTHLGREIAKPFWLRSRLSCRN